MPTSHPGVPNAVRSAIADVEAPLAGVNAAVDTVVGGARHKLVAPDQLVVRKLLERWSSC